jgi:hypothetical protein
VVEVPVDLSERPEGSFSKIRHVRDGLMILLTLAMLWRDYRPLRFFSSIAGFMYSLAAAAGAWAIADFLRSGEMRRLGTALFAVGLVLLGTLFGFVGLVLHTINRRMRELFAKLQSMADDAHAERRSRL